MDTFADLISKWDTTAEFAVELKIPYQTAAAWKRRKSIPPEWWGRVITAARKKDIRLTSDQLLSLRLRGAEMRKAS